MKNKDGYSICIPLSRQQKGFDLVVLNSKTGKSARIQVKSSTSYKHTRDEKCGFWFNNFIDKVDPTISDFYVLFGLHEGNVAGKKLNKVRAEKWWKREFLLFSATEMKELLKELKTKSGTRERFFSIVYDHGNNKLYSERGFDKEYDFTKYTFEENIISLKKYLG